MNWQRIPKENSIQPQKGCYSDWKPQLAEEGFNQCVYCAIHDASMGGQRNFHVEHFRPKSRCPEKTNDISNLFYACPICNCFKGNDWPAEPDFEAKSYLDPSENDYAVLFTVDTQSGEIEGNVFASRYMVEKIHLNRGQLILERRLQILLDQAGILRKEITQLIEQLSTTEPDIHNRFIRILNEMHDLRDQLRTITPYQSHEIKK